MKEQRITMRFKKAFLFITKTVKTRTITGLTIYFSLLGLLVLDKAFTLVNFGFIYTDLDQMIMWNGAMDYANSIFREPFFYGQSYNYMLESFLSVPLLLIGIPVYKALPITTSILTIFPFIFLSICFLKRKQYAWSYFSLLFPVLLPIEYNFLTTLPRGFVQAHLFVPFLFIPFFNPDNKRSIAIFYIASALSFIANQSSVVIIIPIFVLVLISQDNKRLFIKRSIIVLPALLVDYIAKYHYTLHPEKVTHTITGVRIDIPTLLNSMTKIDHFEYLFPLLPNIGIMYIIIFVFLGIYTYKKSYKTESYFIISILSTLLLTFSMPKVQSIYENAGIFFTVSRLYLFLPLLLILSLFLVFKNHKIKAWLLISVIGLSLMSFAIKNHNINSKAEAIVKKTRFPAIKVESLMKEVEDLKTIVNNNKIELVIHTGSSGWKYPLLSYAYKPLLVNGEKNIKLVSLTEDRRTWIYNDSSVSENILIMGISPKKSELDQFEYKKLSNDKYLIKNNKSDNKSLLKALEQRFSK